MYFCDNDAIYDVIVQEPVRKWRQYHRHEINRYSFAELSLFQTNSTICIYRLIDMANFAVRGPSSLTQSILGWRGFKFVQMKNHSILIKQMMFFFLLFNQHYENHMCLLIWTVFSGEHCGPWASCYLDLIILQCINLYHISFWKLNVLWIANSHPLYICIVKYGFLY